MGGTLKPTNSPVKELTICKAQQIDFDKFDLGHPVVLTSSKGPRNRALLNLRVQSIVTYMFLFLLTVTLRFEALVKTMKCLRISEVFMSLLDNGKTELCS